VSTRDTLVRNTFWFGLVTVIGLASGVMMSVVLARWLGPARMGDFSYILWVTRTLTALASLGFAVGTTRYTASALAQGDPALAWGIVERMKRQQFIATAVVAAAMMPIILAVAPDAIRWPLALVCLGLFPITLEHIFSHAVYGANRYDLTTQVSTIKMGLHFAGTVIALALGFDIVGIVVGNMVGTTISALLQQRRARSIYPDTAAPVPPALRHDMRAYLVPLSVVVVLDALVWDRSEVFFLRFWTSSHDIAFYSLAFGLATKAMIFPEITIGALLPTFSGLHGRGAMDEFRGVYRGALRNVTLVGAPIAAVTTAIAPALVTLLYGEVYRPVAALLSVMMIVAVFASMRKVAWTALRGLGDRRCAVTATSVAAAINIAAAVAFIPAWGTWGAVGANTLAQLVATCWAFVVLARTQGCRVPVLTLMRITGAGILSYGAAAALATDEPDLLRIVLAGAAGLATYVGAAVALRVVGAREWRFALSTVHRLQARWRRPPARPTDSETPVKPPAFETRPV